LYTGRAAGLGFALLDARDIHADTRPGLAPIGDGELHVDRPVVQQERLALAAKREPLIRLTGQCLLERLGEVRLRVAKDDVDVLGTLSF
jgi:hypothetical protein